MRTRAGQRRTRLSATKRLTLRRRRAQASAGLPLKLSPKAASASIENVPDLLSATARLGIAAPEIAGAVDFAFAGGSCQDELDAAMEPWTLDPSDWKPECYAEDLFVDALVEEAMAVRLEGRPVPINRAFVARVIAEPPRDPAVAETRRAVLRELADDASLREAFERLYRQLRRLRGFFGQSLGASRYELTRRRIDTLVTIRDIVALGAQHFGRLDSALGRIGAFAEEVRDSEGHARLVELLDYENELASVDVRMKVGVDGKVRSFSIVRLDENTENAFYSGPLARWVTKLVLWWRGYGFNNHELVDRWLDLVFERVSHFIPPMIQLLGHMEVHLAALAFKDRCEEHGLSVCFPTFDEAAAPTLKGLFNPLLFAQGITPKPCSLVGDHDAPITIVTGPNSGGKTRLLQSVGMVQLLGQSGFYAPVEAATVPRASCLFVSVIEEPSATQREGRLGTELIRIRQLFELTRDGGLVVLDELCSGTNPSEGEEIFYLVLSLLGELGPRALITTHFLEFARRLTDDDELGLSFLQVELDEDQHPTYDFVEGVATTSLAAQTAARLGVTREELAQLVRRNKR